MTLHFKPHRNLFEAPMARGPKDVEALKKIRAATGLDIERSPKVDFEDWWEPALMLVAAIDAGYEIVVHGAGGDDTVYAHVPGRPVAAEIQIGRFTSPTGSDAFKKGLDWPRPTNASVNRYASLKAFAKNAGRKIAIADMPGGYEDGTHPLEEAVAEMRGREIMLKQVWPAKSFAVKPYTIPQTPGPHFGSDMIMEIMGYHMCRFEGDHEALLLQDRIDMRYETRFFVVGQKVICGAACIEAHTPFDNRAEGRLDTVFETRRNCGDRFVSKTVRDRLLAAAKTFVAEIAAEMPVLQDYTIDLAIGADDAPLIIELNPINAGFYGLNAHFLLEALIDTTQKGA